jgi:hypothetical protein
LQVFRATRSEQKPELSSIAVHVRVAYGLHRWSSVLRTDNTCGQGRSGSISNPVADKPRPVFSGLGLKDILLVPP